MLRQCSYRGGRCARAVGLPPPVPLQGSLAGRSLLLLEPLLAPPPLRDAATLTKLTNTMQPQDIRWFAITVCTV